MRIRTATAVFVLVFASNAISDEAPKSPQAKELLASIAGRENRPAGEVFKNVQLMKEVPAGRFLRLMDAGFTTALGVDCEHCHVDGRWEADEKRPKRAAREMLLMLRTINDQLMDMKDIDSSDPSVGCITCHRGRVKPDTH